MDKKAKKEAKRRERLAAEGTPSAENAVDPAEPAIPPESV